jgi:hypothetical protein
LLFTRKEEDFKIREQALRARDIDIQEQLVKFSKFLQDNEAKKNRNLERKAQEASEIMAKEKELKKVQAKCTELQLQSAALTKSVNAKKIYEEFLEKVRNKHSEEFKDIDDILNRYNTLHFHKESMAKTKAELEKEIEELREHTAKYKKSTEDQIFDLETSISNMREDIELRDKRKQEKQKELDGISEKAVSQISELGQILLAIDNIYNRCKKRKDKDQRPHHLSKDASDDNFDGKVKKALEQLNEVQFNIDDFTCIAKVAEEAKPSK